jgi:tetratricopeptide (TPR) repeat protein
MWEYHLYGDHEYAELERMVSETLVEADRRGTPRATALCNNFGGILSFHAGRWSEAEQRLRESVDVYRELAAHSGEGSSLQRLGVVLTARGLHEEGMRVLAEALVASERAVLRSHMVTRTYACMARNRLAAGDAEAAVAYMQRGHEEADAHGDCVTCAALILPESVRVYITQGQHEAARRDVERLDAIAEKYGSRAWVAMAHQAHGRYLAAFGESDDACDALTRAQQAFAAYGDSYEALRCQAARAALVGDDAELAATRAALADLGSGGLEGEALNVL